MDKEVKVLSRTPIAFADDQAKFAQFFKLEHWAIDVDGRPDDHIVWRRGDFVLPVVVTKDGHVVLVREAKKAVEQVLIGLPAGAVKKGESIIFAALREVQQETGYIASPGDAVFMGPFYNSPDKSTERHFVVIIENATNSGTQSLDEGEDIFGVLTLPFSEALIKVEIGLHRLALFEARTFLAFRE